MRKLWAMVLCLLLLLCSLPVSAAPERPLAVLYAGSDYQFPNNSYQGITYPNHYEAGKAVLRYVLGGIPYPAVDEALFLGDYEPSSYTSDPQGLQALQSVLQETWGLGPDQVLYLQGNHDHYDMPGLDGAKMVFNEHYNYGTKKGTGYIVPLEREHYHICMIHEDAFPETRPTDDPAVRARKKEAVQETAQALEQYLTKTIAGSSKPVIIMGHLPLHYSRQDNIYARELVDALNRGADAGRNILYLFGHNHSSGYDNYLGGSCIYHSRGAQIPVPDGSAADQGENRYDTVAFDFTYLNAGYVGFVSSAETGTTLSSTILEIYEDRVELRRYNGRGLVNLKNEGCPNTAGKGTELQPLHGVFRGPAKVLLNRLALSQEDGPSGCLEVGSSQKITIAITGAAGYSHVEWNSSHPQIVSVLGTGREAKLTGVSGGTAVIRAKVRDGNGFCDELAMTVRVRPREAVRLDSGQWLWCPQGGSLVAGQTVTDVFVTRQTGEVWTDTPLTLDMLTGCDPDTPGVYRCSVTQDGKTLRENFLLTVWPTEAASSVKVLSQRQLFRPARQLMDGKQYAILGPGDYAMGIRSFGLCYRAVATGVERFGDYAALPEGNWSWTAQGTKTGVTLQSDALRGYLTLGREDFLTLTDNSFRSVRWSLTSEGITTENLGIRCSAGAFYTGQTGNVTLYQKAGERLTTYGYATALRGSVTAGDFAEELRPGGDLVISGRLSDDGSVLFTRRLPITVSMLSGITLEDLLTPGTYTCSVCYGAEIICDGYLLTVR